MALFCLIGDFAQKLSWITDQMSINGSSRLWRKQVGGCVLGKTYWVKCTAPVYAVRFTQYANLYNYCNYQPHP